MSILAVQVFNDRLARQTAMIGIPLVVVAVAVLAAVDLKLISGRRAGHLLVVASAVLLCLSLGFMAYRFARLRL